MIVCHTLAPLAALGLGLVFAGPVRAQDAARSVVSQPVAWSSSFGGELRERFESSRHAAFGLGEPGRNDYFLHRAVLSGELRHATDLRAFVEVVSGLTTGWTGSPPATQDDSLDVFQAYVESSFAVANGQIAFRAGRQALALGASRLVSIRESPNVRRAFDGLEATWSIAEHRRVTAFFVRPVFPDRGVFDDSSSAEQRFWGVYATLPVSKVKSLFVDTYYLALDRAEGTFAVGKARERRHSVGARAFGEREDWDWNLEAAWQWGSFGDSSIRAWTVSIDVGFRLETLPLSPRIGLKADAISGDRNPQDHELGTFNAFFPKLPYFSEANLATPANLLDVQPNVRFELTHNLGVLLSWNGLWKYAAADAFYAPPLVPVEGTTGMSGRDIGWQASILLDWQVAEHVGLTATYVSFEPRSAMRQSGGRAGSFLGAWITWAL